MGWPLDIPALKAAAGTASLGQLAIETGTFRGDTTLTLAREFPRVITIELDPALHARACNRLRAEAPNVECRLGPSHEVLRAVLPQLPPAPAFFYLDAHWSGDASVSWDRSAWKGYGVNTAHLGAQGARPSAREQCPLDEELRAIAELHRGPARILIDDLRALPAEGPGRKDHAFYGEDWSHLSRAMLRGILAPRLSRELVLRKPDRWLLELKEILP